jgi:hypothetical protein
VGKFRRRRAPNGDRAKWSYARRVEFERTRRSFEDAARKANQDPGRPDLVWLTEYIRGFRTRSGAGFARRRARDVTFYLADHGSSELMNTREIEALLYCPDDQDPLSYDPAGSIAASRYARSFGDAAYAAGTMQGYAHYAKGYMGHCKELGVNHLEAPAHVFEDWLASLGRRKAYRTVLNARNAVSHLLRKNGRPDIARTERVEQLLVGLRNIKPPKLPTALTSEERYRIISSIESEGLGIRDRVGILICGFSRWGAERAALIDVEHISFSAQGVVFKDGANREPFIIGRHSNPELNLEPWIRKLIAQVGGTGPLFQLYEFRKMGFTGERLSSQTFCKTLRSAAKRAGVEPKNVTTRLRLLFELEMRDEHPDVVLRYFNIISKRAKATNPDDRAARLKTHRKTGFSIITP